MNRNTSSPNAALLIAALIGLGSLFFFLNRPSEPSKSLQKKEVSGRPDEDESLGTNSNANDSTMSDSPSQTMAAQKTAESAKGLDPSNASSEKESNMENMENTDARTNESQGTPGVKTDGSDANTALAANNEATSYGDQLEPSMSVNEIHGALKKILPEAPTAVFENLPAPDHLQGSSLLLQGRFQGDLTQFDAKGKATKVDRLNFESDLKESSEGPIVGSIKYSVSDAEGKRLVDSSYEAEGLIRQSPQESNIFFLQINPQVLWQIIAHKDEKHLYINQFQEGRLNSVGRLMRME